MLFREVGRLPACFNRRPRSIRAQVIGQRILIDAERRHRAERLRAIEQLVAERRAGTARLEAEAATLARAERGQHTLATALLNGEVAPGV